MCGSPLVRLEGEANHHCINAECPQQQVQRIVYFAGRGAMDIEGLGEERVRQFVDADLLGDAGDIYTLTVERLVPLERMAEKSAENLVVGRRPVAVTWRWRACWSGSASTTSVPPRRRRLLARDGRHRRASSRHRSRSSPPSTESVR